MKYSDFPQSIVDENVDYTVKEISNVIKKYGPRESGNANCFAAQKHLKKELDIFCDETDFEPYKLSPKALLHFTKIISAAIILAVVVCGCLVFTSIINFFVAQYIVGGVVTVSLLITLMEFVLYKQFTDPFYKKVEGHNLIGVRKPRGEVKRRIVICGHIDAAYQWRHNYYSSEKIRLMIPLTYGTIISACLSFVVCVLAIIGNFVNMGEFGDFVANFGYLFHFLTALWMITLYLFVDFSTVSPGANDNLTGTYTAVCALRMLDMAGIDFENTEVCAMITDGEEAGLRGAKQFAKQHKAEYTDDDVETVVICVDTIADMDYFRVYTKDLSGSVKNSKALGDMIISSANEADYDNIKHSAVYFGASDAAAFSQAGITATCLAAMDPKPALYYHNRRDTADGLVPEAIREGFEVILSTIFNFDENGLNK